MIARCVACRRWSRARRTARGPVFDRCVVCWTSLRSPEEAKAAKARLRAAVRTWVLAAPVIPSGSRPGREDTVLRLDSTVESLAETVNERQNQCPDPLTSGRNTVTSHEYLRFAKVRRRLPNHYERVLVRERMRYMFSSDVSQNETDIGTVQRTPDGDIVVHWEMSVRVRTPWS